jgi:hypothetical protein
MDRSRRDVARRVFITCWLVYSLHVATNMIRENYLALAIGDHLSFRVDEYAGMHDDIFEHPGFGWHIGSNPGASMLAAIPYALSRPILDPVIRAVQDRRREAGATSPPTYDAPLETDRRLYEEAWRRGFDVKFGIASVIMQSLCMAVISALGVVLMYLVLAGWLKSSRTALWLALLYAFGTPLFYRTGFLNHNMMMGTFGFFGFAMLWNRWGWSRVSDTGRFFLAGLAGGVCVLLDYSGILLLLGLGAYGAATLREREGARGVLASGSTRRLGAWAVGAIGPLALLWFYQWTSFGHPLYPPQHWMPPVEYIELGYQGITTPSPELAGMLAFDYRFGLFVSCPLFLLALASPFFRASGRAVLPRRELIVCGAIVLAFFLFFSGVHYTRWQFNTGIRYLAPTFPFLFLLSAVTLMRLPGLASRILGGVSIVFAWMMAMSRDVSGGKVELTDQDTGLGVLDPVLSVLGNGPQLPALTTLSRMEGYGFLTSGLLQPWQLFLFLGVLLVLVWRKRPVS